MDRERWFYDVLSEGNKEIAASHFAQCFCGVVILKLQDSFFGGGEDMDTMLFMHYGGVLS